MSFCIIKKPYICYIRFILLADSSFAQYYKVMGKHELYKTIFKKREILDLCPWDTKAFSVEDRSLND